MPGASVQVVERKPMPYARSPCAGRQAKHEAPLPRALEQPRALTPHPNHRRAPPNSRPPPPGRTCHRTPTTIAFSPPRHPRQVHGARRYHMCWALFICVGEREAAYSIVHQSHMLGRARLGQGALPRVVGGPSAARDERRFAGNYPGTSRRNMNARESPTDLAFADEKPKQTRFIFRCPFVLRHSPNANICPSFVTIFSLRGERSSLFDSAPKPYARAGGMGALPRVVVRLKGGTRKNLAGSVGRTTSQSA